MSRSKVRNNVLTIFKNLDFLKDVYQKSKTTDREYLIVLGEWFSDYYQGDKGSADLSPLQKYMPETVHAILHTHPRGPDAPSIQDMIATEYILWKFDKLAIHGIISNNNLILYNYYTVDTTRLNKVFANDLATKLTPAEKFGIAHPYVVNIGNFNILSLPDIIDHFALWEIYWRILGHGLYIFEYQDLDLYNKLKEKAVFIPRGRQEVYWYGRREANIGWLALELDADRHKAWFYKVSEFVVGDNMYKVILQDYGFTNEIDNIKFEDIIEECKKKQFCRVI
ncbi:hypothetical protein QIT30_gp34 [Saccharolobus solfataricus rod-shaped virus 1]|uniref:Uncharacterized protein n=1 Tax=Saccharolobus solfataricus rod-shaped virus 1 TaxID=2730619 RepID=A0A6M3VYP3_SSRV1|nr:hypothetical protein QIT30_gp34 [Saccharolobus solfataricus rod-shaped virus 1]QJF12310.1 hypothetical protein SSRV1_gp34 [Saccharolobus solfataricus rod-shaped virus 1]